MYWSLTPFLHVVRTSSQRSCAHQAQTEFWTQQTSSISGCGINLISATCWLCDLMYFIWLSCLSIFNYKMEKIAILADKVVVRIKKYNAYNPLQGLGHYMHCNILAMFIILLFYSVQNPESIHRKCRNWIIFKI